jgi:hypothetical protein
MGSEGNTFKRAKDSLFLFKPVSWISRVLFSISISYSESGLG